ncbi:MAG TPA: DUF6660 family protein [Pelobium sp.]
MHSLRVFSSILLLLILAMNFKPCADQIFIGKNDVVVSQLETAHNHSHPDDCSPFCYCACCAIRSFSSTQLALNHFTSAAITQKPPFVLGGSLQISLPIWQPPKLV